MKPVIWDGNCGCPLGNGVGSLMALSKWTWSCISSSTKSVTVFVEGSWRTRIFAHHGIKSTHMFVPQEWSCLNTDQVWSHVSLQVWQKHSSNQLCKFQWRAGFVHLHTRSAWWGRKDSTSNKCWEYRCFKIQERVAFQLKREILSETK